MQDFGVKYLQVLLEHKIYVLCKHLDSIVHLLEERKTNALVWAVSVQNLIVSHLIVVLMPCRN